MKKVYDITLRLSDIDHLFDKPELSPFSEYYQPYSHAAAIEYIADELYADPANESVRVTILIPAAKLRPGLVESTLQAVRNYAKARRREVRDSVRGLRWRGSKGFRRGAVLLIILGGVGKWLAIARDLPGQVASEGLLIAGTLVFEMALWDFFIHAWQERLDEKVYSKIINMDLTIKPDRAPARHGE